MKLFSYIVKPLLFLSLLLPLSLFASIEQRQFNNPSEEALYTALIKELRCLVCQNQNLADSNATLAKDLRQKTYEMVSEGKTREQVSDYMTTRYGDFVLYSPPMKSSTYFLWLGPFTFLLIALFILASFIRNKNAKDDNAVSTNELKRAKKLLDD